LRCEAKHRGGDPPYEPGHSVPPFILGVVTLHK
jgi:hypothetical protein